LLNAFRKKARFAYLIHPVALILALGLQLEPCDEDIKQVVGLEVGADAKQVVSRDRQRKARKNFAVKT
jgi:hypothetical protein